jgi:hypothetical protein
MSASSDTPTKHNRRALAIVLVCAAAAVLALVVVVAQLASGGGERPRVYAAPLPQAASVERVADDIARLIERNPRISVTALRARAGAGAAVQVRRRGRHVEVCGSEPAGTLCVAINRRGDRVAVVATDIKQARSLLADALRRARSAKGSSATGRRVR